MQIRPIAVAVALALALVATGCSKEEGGTAAGTTTPPTTAAPSPTSESPSPAESPTVTESPSPSPPASPALEDGRHFGYIQWVDLDTDPYTMTFDLAYFLTGEEANQAAAERGDETPVPNDYYIVNDNPKLRTLELSPDVEIVLVNWEDCCDSFTGDIHAFAASFKKKKHTLGNYPGKFSQYWLTVEGGVVVGVEEQYLP